MTPEQQRRHNVTVMILGVALLVAACFLMPLLSAQEQQHVTRTWQMAVIDNEWPASDVRVSVIDSEGVCLYVAHEYDHDRIAITSVPKTSLRPGVGCQ